ncbi:Putative serine/threonine-protein kinase, active [Septoria linicola]|uniref:non-specific serine/threonine protein kinase n=1 Tax=Septoria linicola TaxID=215465 RepID=A0A9Q9EGK2_9PEZI|nr:putative serine/threonine-protein kinase, active [Septoria linicola]USW48902.1 Putative serine/threonine-protein kinase, active [Septoria linicola]
MFPNPMIGGGLGMGGFRAPLPMNGMPMMPMGGGPFGGGWGGAEPAPGMPRGRRASFGGGMPFPGAIGPMQIPVGRGLPGMIQPGGGPDMPMRGGLPRMGGMVGMNGMGGMGDMGGMGVIRGPAGMGGMGGRAVSPGANFDPSRNAPPRGRRPSMAFRPDSPHPRGRSRSQGRGRRIDPSRSSMPEARRAQSPFPAPRGVRFNPQHQGARFDQHAAPINMQQAQPHAYGLNPEPRPRTIGQMFRDNDVPMVDFEFVKALAPGGMSTAINLVKNRTDGKLYIEKRIRTDSGRRKPAVREIRTLNKITREYGVGGNLNTLVMSKAIRDGNLWCLILDYCDRGSLMDLQKSANQSGRPINEVTMWNVLQGVAHGLAFLHDGIKEIKPNGVHDKTPGWDTICHLDIKPQNIFLHSEGGAFGLPRVVLADFGCAVSLSDVRGGAEQHVMQPCGTPAWYPPEGNAHNPQYYGTKTDMWALGLTVFALCRLQIMPKLQAYSREALCGSQYGQRLNATVRTLTAGDSNRRPAARHVASASMHILQEKMRGDHRGRE